MKTRNILAILGIASLTAITLNVNADTLLSPRATGNRIASLAQASGDRQASAAQLVSPRALGSQSTVVSGVINETTPISQCLKMTASPKAIQACATNPSGMACKTVVADSSVR